MILCPYILLKSQVFTYLILENGFACKKTNAKKKRIEKAWRNSSDSCTTYCYVGFLQKKIIVYYLWYFNANGLTCELQNLTSFDLEKGNIIGLENIVIKIIRVWYLAWPFTILQNDNITISWDFFLAHSIKVSRGLILSLLLSEVKKIQGMSVFF